MARMFPETLEGLAVQSPAERRLFEAFESQLGDDFCVLHSVAWLGIPGPHESPADGEADFVIMHPHMGVLVLEVKGGTVGFDAGSGWYSILHDGERLAIKNPFAQVKRNKYALLRKIRSLPNWQGRVPTIGHAVALPDGNADLPALGPEAPRAVLLLRSDLGDLPAWVAACMGFWTGPRAVFPGEDGVKALLGLLRRSWVLTDPSIGDDLPMVGAEIRRLTEQQFAVLDWLAGRPRAAIRGCAGSGKTMLALEKARRLAGEGFRTLLTCYNRNLAAFLRGAARDVPRLSVHTFHALCYDYASRCGRDRESDWSDRGCDFFDEVMPTALASAVRAHPRLAFDAIVVDEGQDFRSNWWKALAGTLQNPQDGILYVFFDDNQLVYERPTCLPVAEAPFALTTNCRNTQSIHRSVAEFYQSDLPLRCVGPEGRAVAIHTYQGDQISLRARLTEIVTRLVFAEHVKPGEIVVLSPRGLGGPPLKGMERPGAFWLTQAPSTREDEVQCTTIRLFKGLERPVVVLVVPEEAASENELLYVGLSRASAHVELLVADGALDPISARLCQVVSF